MPRPFRTRPVSSARRFVRMQVRPRSTPTPRPTRSRPAVTWLRPAWRSTRASMLLTPSAAPASASVRRARTTIRSSHCFVKPGLMARRSRKSFVDYFRSRREPSTSQMTWHQESPRRRSSERCGALRSHVLWRPAPSRSRSPRRGIETRPAATRRIVHTVCMDAFTSRDDVHRVLIAGDTHGNAAVGRGADENGDRARLFDRHPGRRLPRGARAGGARCRRARPWRRPPPTSAPARGEPVARDLAGRCRARRPSHHRPGRSRRPGAPRWSAHRPESLGRAPSGVHRAGHPAAVARNIRCRSVAAAVDGPGRDADPGPLVGQGDVAGEAVAGLVSGDPVPAVEGGGVGRQLGVSTPTRKIPSLALPAARLRLTVAPALRSRVSPGPVL